MLYIFLSPDGQVLSADKCWLSPTYTKMSPSIGDSRGTLWYFSISGGRFCVCRWMICAAHICHIHNKCLCLLPTVYFASWFVPSSARDKSTRSAARSDVAGAFIGAENATLKLWSCTGHSFHFTASDLPSESTEGFGLAAFFDIVYPEGQIIFSTFTLWFLLHNPAKHRDAPPEWRGGITQVCLWTIMI